MRRSVAEVARMPALRGTSHRPGGGRSPRGVSGIGALPGAAYLSPVHDDGLIRRAVPGRAPTGLTRRETEVLVLIAGALSNAEIAERLGIAEATVKTHVNHIFAKMHLRNRVQAVIFAYENRLVVPGEGVAPSGTTAMRSQR